MASKEPNDLPDDIAPAGNSAPSATADETQNKKRARRRLVGAMAMVLFAIVVLPVVMDREPPPTAPEIQVRIPSPDSQGLTSQPKSAVKPGKAALATAAKPAPEAANAPAPESAAAGASTAPASDSPAQSKPAATESARPDSAKPEAAESAKPEPAKAEPAKAEPTKAESKETATPATAAATGKWEVQLGAYGNAGNVTILLAKLKELKVPTYTEKFSTPQGPRTRVRAGPYATKEQAIAAQKRIRIISVDGTVAPSSK
jgi:DedD protein